MLFGVSANRMTLLNLRKRLSVARRGHTLMKHKYDELMHIFQEEIKAAFQLRRETDIQVKTVYNHSTIAKSMMDKTAISNLSAMPIIGIQLNETRENVLNLKVPAISANVMMDSPPYDLNWTNSDLDTSVKELAEVIPRLFQLAAIQKKLQLIAQEIEVTRRRVNALEYVLIPQLEEQIRYIQMKLDEAERSNNSRLMRIKSIIRGEK